MSDPFFLAATELTRATDTISQATDTNKQAVLAEKQRLDQILRQLRTPAQPEVRVTREFAPAPLGTPYAGSQLYHQRLQRLRAGQRSLRSGPSRPVGGAIATQQPTYQQWQTLLAYEASVAARSTQKQPLGILLGDSLSLWFPSDRLPQNRRWLNQSISGDTTRGILQRLSRFAKTRPRVIYLMAGVNDLKQGSSNNTILWNLRQIITRLRQQHPQAQIVVQSILPTAALGLSSDRIATLNQHLQAIATQHGAYYLDVYSSMADAEGNLRPDLTTDGVHLNARGYATWQSVLHRADLHIAQRR